MPTDIPAAATPEFTPSTNWMKRLGKVHPIGFWFVFSGELAERASVLRTRTIVLYMTSELGFTTGGGATVMKVFMASCYITPFFGGWIADRYLGQYKRLILYYSLPYILGHIILGEFPTKTNFFRALVLLAFGSGAIKLNTSVLMGKIYDHAGEARPPHRGVQPLLRGRQHRRAHHVARIAGRAQHLRRSCIWRAPSSPRA